MRLPCTGCFSEMIKCTAYQIDDAQIILIVSESDESSELQPSYLTSLMHKVKDTVQKIAHISVTIGISSVSQNALKINERYKEACECTKYRLFMGEGTVVSKDMITQFEDSEISENIVQHVLNSVKTSNKDEFDILINNILKTCSKHTYEKLLYF